MVMLGADKTEDHLARKLSDFGLGYRSLNPLKQAQIIYVGDLVQRTELELSQLPNFGQNSLNQVKMVLRDLGLRLAA